MGHPREAGTAETEDLDLQARGFEAGMQLAPASLPGLWRGQPGDPRRSR